MVHALVILSAGGARPTLPGPAERALAVVLVDSPSPDVAAVTGTRPRGRSSVAQVAVAGAGAATVDTQPPATEDALIDKPRSAPPRPAEDANETSQHARARVESRLRAHLARHFVYPELARQRGWEGEVVLRVIVVPPGNVERIQLARSSGYHVIDQAALRALEQAKLPELETLSHAFEMQLPIIYRLRGG